MTAEVSTFEKFELWIGWETCDNINMSIACWCVRAGRDDLLAVPWKQQYDGNRSETSPSSLPVVMTPSNVAKIILPSSSHLSPISLHHKCARRAATDVVRSLKNANIWSQQNPNFFQSLHVHHNWHEQQKNQFHFLPSEFCAASIIYLGVWLIKVIALEGTLASRKCHSPSTDGETERFTIQTSFNEPRNKGPEILALVGTPTQRRLVLGFNDAADRRAFEIKQFS